MHLLEISCLSVLSDAGGTRNSAPGKENGPSRVPGDSVAISSTPTLKDLKNKVTSAVR